ncbi:MAG TPA: RDD family protein [Ktedonobacterales bacterium]
MAAHPAPRAHAAHPPNMPLGTPAGFISRAAAFVTDVVLLAVAIFLVATLTGWILSFFTLGTFHLRSTDPAGPVVTTARTVLQIFTLVVSILLILCYPLFFWVMIGQTPGKALLGLRVARQDGRRLTLGVAALRLAGYWLSALPLGLGFLWVLVDPQREAWHDKLAGTSVTYLPEPSPAQRERPRAPTPTRPLPSTP